MTVQLVMIVFWLKSIIILNYLRMISQCVRSTTLLSRHSNKMLLTCVNGRVFGLTEWPNDHIHKLLSPNLSWLSKGFHAIWIILVSLDNISVKRLLPFVNLGHYFFIHSLASFLNLRDFFVSSRFHGVVKRTNCTFKMRRKTWIWYVRFT